MLKMYSGQTPAATPFVESFAAYVRGERDILDPDFVQYLDKNVAKGVAKSAISGVKDNVQYRDVTKEYFDRSTPNKGILEYSKPENSHEVIIAKKIYKTFGGDIKVLNENNPMGERNPDYLWNTKYWELKGPKEESGINSAVKQALKQIKRNPGGIVLDICEAENVSKETMNEKILQRMKWTKKGTDIDIMLMHKHQLLCIINYKKI